MGDDYQDRTSHCTRRRSTGDRANRARSGPARRLARGRSQVLQGVRERDAHVSPRHPRPRGRHPGEARPPVDPGRGYPRPRGRDSGEAGGSAGRRLGGSGRGDVGLGRHLVAGRDRLPARRPARCRALDGGAGREAPRSCSLIGSPDPLATAAREGGRGVFADGAEQLRCGVTGSPATKQPGPAIPAATSSERLGRGACGPRPSSSTPTTTLSLCCQPDQRHRRSIRSQSLPTRAFASAHGVGP
jgi:hypothetical protein